MDRAPETADEIVTGSSGATVPGARRPVDDEPDGWLESDAVDDPTEPAGVAGAAGAVTVEESGTACDVGDGLTERERQVLAFERQWWRHAGAKEQAIRDLFGISSTRYYQTLNALLDKPAALACDPVLVQRLRRLRATRARARGRSAR